MRPKHQFSRPMLPYEDGAVPESDDKSSFEFKDNPKFSFESEKFSFCSEAPFF